MHRPGAGGVWHPTAALVVEILSPGDETREKLPFYARHEVDEVVIVDPVERAVEWLALEGDGYEAVARSGLLDGGPAALAAEIEWPAPDAATPGLDPAA
jgi:hypothetical protein